METPQSMKAELARWNGGQGIDLEGWLAASGNYACVEKEGTCRNEIRRSS